jgi:predicted ArsR family transcriptional regulator
VKRGEDIDHSILHYPAEQNWPVTTKMVAEKLGASWNTAQTRLHELTAEGKVKGRQKWMMGREAKANI